MGLGGGGAGCKAQRLGLMFKLRLLDLSLVQRTVLAA